MSKTKVGILNKEPNPNEKKKGCPQLLLGWLEACVVCKDREFNSLKENKNMKTESEEHTISTYSNFSYTSNKTSYWITKYFGLQIPFQIKNWPICKKEHVISANQQTGTLRGFGNKLKQEQCWRASRKWNKPHTWYLDPSHNQALTPKVQDGYVSYCLSETDLEELVSLESFQ